MEPILVVVVVAVGVIAVAAGLLVSVRRRPGSAPAKERDDSGAGVAEAPPQPVPGTPLQAPPVPEAPPAEVTAAEAARAEPEAPPSAPPLTLRERFARRLTRTRNTLGVSVAELFGRGVSDDAWQGLEEALIGADVGVEASLQIVEDLRRRARAEGATTAPEVVALLKDELRQALGSADRRLARAADQQPTVWLVTGVNGTGKTTTIGKLAAREQRDGRSAVLAAADTFRAAAADQLGVWAERTGARLVRKPEGADPASVAYDGYQAAYATDADVLIVDTAGRLHNKRELMDELTKLKRVVEKQAGPLEETLLVLDATTGQNGIAQARAFTDAVAVTGIALTKLDGTSKGGIVVAVQRELGLPVKLVGLGEGVDDLADFDPDAFVAGLFPDVDA